MLTVDKILYGGKISAYSVFCLNLVTIFRIGCEVVQCHIVLLVSYGVELSVVETIHSDTLVIALI